MEELVRVGPWRLQGVQAVGRATWCVTPEPRLPQLRRRRAFEFVSWAVPPLRRVQHVSVRGRDCSCEQPPAQIRARGATAHGSYLG
jgi:hypothetical protein